MGLKKGDGLLQRTTIKGQNSFGADSSWAFPDHGRI